MRRPVPSCACETFQCALSSASVRCATRTSANVHACLLTGALTHALTHSQRAKDQIKSCDVKAYKTFIQEECSKVERFYRSKLEDIETEGNELAVLMAQSSSQVSGLVKRSWNHTEELRGLYDYGRLNHEGIRKALKKYDKVMKYLKPELQVL